MNLKRSFNLHHFIVFFLSGIILNPIVVYATNKIDSAKSSPPQSYWLIATVVIVLAISGSLGGFVYALLIRENSSSDVTFPNRRLDFILSNSAIGVVGAFLIAPIALKFTTNLFADLNEFLLLITTGLLGGFGGRTIINYSSSKFFDKIGIKIEKKLKPQIENHVDDNLHRQNKHNAEAIELVIDRQFDLDFISSPMNNDQLKSAIIAASSGTRAYIFGQAKQLRIQTFKDDDLSRMERTIPVFEALIESTSEARLLHRYHAQLAYVFKDKKPQDWTRSEAEFTESIELRKRIYNEKDTFWFYEFNRAICRIKLNEIFKEENDENQYWKKNCNAILQDLRVANRSLEQETNDEINIVFLLKPELARDDRAKTLTLESLKLQDEAKKLILKWLNKNDLELVDLTMEPTNLA